MNIKELIASFQSIYEIYGDIPCVQLDMGRNINSFKIQLEIKNISVIK